MDIASVPQGSKKLHIEPSNFSTICILTNTDHGQEFHIVRAMVKTDKCQQLETPHLRDLRILVLMVVSL